MNLKIWARVTEFGHFKHPWGYSNACCCHYSRIIYAVRDQSKYRKLIHYSCFPIDCEQILCKRSRVHAERNPRNNLEKWIASSLQHQKLPILHDLALTILLFANSSIHYTAFYILWVQLHSPIQLVVCAAKNCFISLLNLLISPHFSIFRLHNLCLCKFKRKSWRRGENFVHT